MEKDNLDPEEEIILYINSRSLEKIEIPNFGIIEKLNNYYWLSEEFGLIPVIDIFKEWWENNLGKKTKYGQSAHDLFDGKRCLVNYRDNGWMYGTAVLIKSYSSDYYVVVPEPRYSLIDGKEKHGTLRIDSEYLNAVISFRNLDKFKKIIKELEDVGGDNNLYEPRL